MTVNSSIILMTEKNIPRVQVDNPELLTLTRLSARQVQVHAKKTGLTKVTLWDEENNVYTVDVSIYGDTRELTELLRAEFPGAAITVRPTAAGVVLGGFVDRADDVNRIVTMAPGLLSQGDQQHLRRRRAAGDSAREGDGSLAHRSCATPASTSPKCSARATRSSRSTAAGLTKLATLPQVVAGASAARRQRRRSPRCVNSLSQPTISLGVLNQFNNGFYGFIQFLQRNNILKVLAEPTLVTTSGRPAYFLSGGEMPIPVPQSLGTMSIQFRKFGTQVDFVPIVLGSGRIHLEVRPKISEIDPTVSITLNGSTIPGFRTRECDTGVEMNAGQTMALAGLIQTDVQSQVQGIPYLMDIPYLGLAFRRTTDTIEETELLITVRPELGEAMNCEQVPPVGPGVGTMIPDDCGFYFKGYNEVPAPPMPGPGGPGGPGGPAGMGPRHGADGADGTGHGTDGTGHGADGPGGGHAAGAVPESMEEVPNGAGKTAPPDGQNRGFAGQDGGSAAGGRVLTARPAGTPAGAFRRVRRERVHHPAPIGIIVPNRRVRPPRPKQIRSASPLAFIGATGYDVSN